MTDPVILQPTIRQRLTYAAAAGAIGYALFRAIASFRVETASQIPLSAQIRWLRNCALLGFVIPRQHRVVWNEEEASSQACRLGKFMLEQGDNKLSDHFEHAYRQFEIDSLERQLARGVPFAELRYSEPDRAPYLRAHLFARLAKRSGNDQVLSDLKEVLKQK